MAIKCKNALQNKLYNIVLLKVIANTFEQAISDNQFYYK